MPSALVASCTPSSSVHDTVREALAAVAGRTASVAAIRVGASEKGSEAAAAKTNMELVAATMPHDIVVLSGHDTSAAFGDRKRTLRALALTHKPVILFEPREVPEIDSRGSSHVRNQDELFAAVRHAAERSILARTLDGSRTAVGSAGRLSFGRSGAAQAAIRLLVLYDMPGWAWWHRAHHLRRHLYPRISVVTKQMDEPFDHHDYDFVLIFDYLTLRSMKSILPPEKLILGCSCPKLLPTALQVMSASGAAGLVINNRDTYLQAVASTNAGRGAQNVFCCQNGVDSDFFVPAETPMKSPVACFVGYTKSMGEKGLDIIKAACERTNVPLVTLEREQHVLQQVFTQTEVRNRIYHRSSFYVCASVFEGTPNTALEALSCGLPVLSTRVGNMTELIRDGYNGYLFDRSVEGLASAIDRLKQGSLTEMSLNARASILDGWTWKQQSAKYAEMLGSLLDARKRRPARRPEDPLLEPSALGL